MSRALRLGSIAAILAVYGLTSAQSPTSPSHFPSPFPTPAPATPGVTPIPGQDPTTPSPALPGAAATIPAGRSTWRAQDGSIADLTIDPAAGTLTGTFAPGFPCGAQTGLAPEARPVVGTVSGTALAWTLSLPACPSVGTWIGHYQVVGGEEQLTVLFTLAVAETPPGVGSNLTGAAVFVREVTATP